MAGDAGLLVGGAGHKLPGVCHVNSAIAKDQRDGIGSLVEQRCGGLVGDRGGIAILGLGDADTGAVKGHLDAEWIHGAAAIDDYRSDSRIHLHVDGILARTDFAHVRR